MEERPYFEVLVEITTTKKVVYLFFADDESDARLCAEESAGEDGGPAGEPIVMSEETAVEVKYVEKTAP